MNATAAGAIVLLAVALLVGMVFLAVVSVVALVKVIQIAEDVRYLRSKGDLSVGRPRSWKNTLAVCLVVSLILIVVVVPLAVTPLLSMLPH